MRADVLVVEQAAVAEAEDAAVICRLPAAAPEAPLACPNCGRTDTLMPAGDVLFCAACGYASDGVRGCT
jgi:hypothetical protein